MSVQLRRHVVLTKDAMDHIKIATTMHAEHTSNPIDLIAPDKDRQEYIDEKGGCEMRRIVISFFLTFVVLCTFAASSLAANINVSVVDFAFQPQTVTINVDDSVTWTLSGSALAPHTATHISWVRFTNMDTRMCT